MENRWNNFGAGSSQPLRLPILTYHSIDESGSVISTPPEVFRRQIEHFAESGFRCTTLSEAWTSVKTGRSSQDPLVVITFDDGLRSVHENALEVLEKYDFTATLFVVTECLGCASPWLKSSDAIPRFPLMTEKEIRDLMARGWEIGGHSTQHSRLTAMREERLEQDLIRCRDVITALSGNEIPWFAYPYGLFNSQVKRLVGRYFGGACTTELDIADTGSDPLALERIDMYYLRSPICFSRLGTPLLNRYLALRRRLRAIRKIWGQSPLTP
jgi:peptidoglycan/xylan/chitin deacetylase (PgdA/CDA1 family)